MCPLSNATSRSLRRPCVLFTHLETEHISLSGAASKPPFAFSEGPSLSLSSSLGCHPPPPFSPPFTVCPTKRTHLLRSPQQHCQTNQKSARSKPPPVFHHSSFSPPSFSPPVSTLLCCAKGSQNPPSFNKDSIQTQHISESVTLHHFDLSHPLQTQTAASQFRTQGANADAQTACSMRQRSPLHGMHPSNPPPRPFSAPTRRPYVHLPSSFFNHPRAPRHFSSPLSPRNGAA